MTDLPDELLDALQRRTAERDEPRGPVAVRVTLIMIIVTDEFTLSQDTVEAFRS